MSELKFKRYAFRGDLERLHELIHLIEKHYDYAQVEQWKFEYKRDENTIRIWKEEDSNV